MLIVALDLAVQTGWAKGKPGEQPTSGVIRVKEPSDPLFRAPRKLYSFLRDLNAFGDLPDIIGYEAGLSVNARPRDPRTGEPVPQSEESLLMPIKLEQAVQDWCLDRDIGPAGFPRVYPATIRKHFLGKANYGTKLLTKQAVAERCMLLGYVRRQELPKSATHILYDQCDALALWDYLSAKYGRAHDRRLVLFGEHS